MMNTNVMNNANTNITVFTTADIATKYYGYTKQPFDSANEFLKHFGYTGDEVIIIENMANCYYIKNLGRDRVREVYGRVGNDMIHFFVEDWKVCHYTGNTSITVYKDHYTEIALKPEVNTPHEALNKEGELIAPFKVHEGQHVKIVSRWGDIMETYTLLPNIAEELYTPTYDPKNTILGTECLMYDTFGSRGDNYKTLTNMVSRMAQAGCIDIENFLYYHEEDLRIIFQEEFETVSKQLIELFYEMNN